MPESISAISVSLSQHAGPRVHTIWQEARSRQHQTHSVGGSCAVRCGRGGSDVRTPRATGTSSTRQPHTHLALADVLPICPPKNLVDPARVYAIKYSDVAAAEGGTGLAQAAAGLGATTMRQRGENRHRTSRETKDSGASDSRHTTQCTVCNATVAQRRARRCEQRA